MKKFVKILAVALVAAVAAAFAACSGEHVHEFEIVESRPATCTENGYERRRCKECNVTEENTLPALGHNFGSDNKCLRCGFEIKSTEGLVYVLTEDRTGYLVAIGTAKDGDVVVPAYYNRKPVVGVRNDGFAYHEGSSAEGGKNVQSVSLPDGLVSIGESAFYGCVSLKSINLPAGLQTIGNSAFYGCAALTGLTGGKDVQTIGKSAFSGCVALAGLPAFESVKTIGQFAFYGCAGLQTANILSGALESLGDNVFADCAALKYATLSGIYETLPSCTFVNCASLTEVALPASLKTIGSTAFGSCDALKAIRFGGNMEQWKGVDRASDAFASRLDPEEFADFYVYCSDGILDRYGFQTVPPKD